MATPGAGKRVEEQGGEEGVVLVTRETLWMSGSSRSRSSLGQAGQGVLPGRLCLPSYLFDRWMVGGGLSAGHQSVWVALAHLVLSARAAGHGEVCQVTLTVRQLAEMLGVRSADTVRRRILDPIRRGGVASSFISEVDRAEALEEAEWQVDPGPSASPAHMGLVLRPALVVPVHPADTVGAVPPETDRSLEFCPISTEATPSGSVGRNGGSRMDWARVRREMHAWPHRNEDEWEHLKARILVPLFRLAGEAEPESVLDIPAIRDPMTQAVRRLGRRRSAEILERIEGALSSAERPISYALKVLAAEAGTPSSRRPGGRTSTEPTRSPGSGAGEGGPGWERGSLSREEMERWVSQLAGDEASPFGAKMALLALERSAPGEDSDASGELVSLRSRMERLARRALEGKTAGPPA